MRPLVQIFTGINKIIIASHVMVWFSNLCFDPNTIDKIFQKLVNELPNQSIICSSKPPNIVIDKCEYKDSILVPMSWIEIVVFIFIK